MKQCHMPIGKKRRRLSQLEIIGIYRYALVIPTISCEPLFGQDLAFCDYFRTSVKIALADMCTLVGEITGLKIHKMAVVSL